MQYFIYANINALYSGAQWRGSRQAQVQRCNPMIYAGDKLKRANYNRQSFAFVVLRLDHE